MPHRKLVSDGGMLYRTPFSLQMELDSVESCRPCFFNVSVDCLSESLCNTQTGCNVGWVMVNHLMMI